MELGELKRRWSWDERGWKERGEVGNSNVLIM